MRNNVIPMTIHPSEWDWANSKMDWCISNNFDKEYLKNQVVDLLAST